MLKFFKNLIFGKNILDVVEAKKKVRVHGVKFVITKISVLDHMQGGKVLAQSFARWNDKKALENVSIDNSLQKKIKAHYADVFMASVVTPKLSRKPDEVGCLLVDHLMTDWSFAEELYNKILIYTYGKKKVKSFISQAKKQLR